MIKEIKVHRILKWAFFVLVGLVSCAEAQPSVIAKLVVVSGTVRAIVNDEIDLSGSITKGRTLYFLETKTNHIVLKETEFDLAPYTNKEITIKGVLSDDQLKCLNVKNISKDQTSQVVPGDLIIPPPTAVPRKTLVILFNFQNDTSQPLTVEQVRGKVFTDVDSISNNFKEVSFNKFYLISNINPQGDIQPWITIPFDNTNCNANLLNTWRQAADDIAEINGFSKIAYPLRLYMYPPISSCSIGPVGTVGFFGDSTQLINRSFINLTPGVISILRPVIVHEIGHNLGISQHSGVQETPTSPIFVNDRTDVMSSTINSSFHNINRVRLGWFLGKMTSLVEPGTYSVTLNTPVVPNKKDQQMIRIPLKDSSGMPIGQSIWLESRKKYNFFDIVASNLPYWFSGVTIRYVDDDLTSNTTQPTVRDTTPGSPLGPDDAPLQPGLVYNDSTYGITIENLRGSDSIGDRVKITLTR